MSKDTHVVFTYFVKMVMKAIKWEVRVYTSETYQPSETVCTFATVQYSTLSTPGWNATSLVVANTHALGSSVWFTRPCRPKLMPAAVPGFPSAVIHLIWSEVSMLILILCLISRGATNCIRLIKCCRMLKCTAIEDSISNVLQDYLWPIKLSTCQ